MADAAENKLLITAVDGTTLSFTCNADYRFNNGVARFSGFYRDDRITFILDRWTRGRFTQLQPVVGLNVRQTVNRAGRIQLTSDKPCKFVKCRWDEANNMKLRGYALEEPNIQEIEGVLEVTTASLEGMQESLALTLLRGDWLWQDGAVERFV